MTPAQASFLAEHYTQLMQREFAATRKVLGAVKDDTRTYRPDDRSRTAWELAVHLVTADLWFLDSIVIGQFVWDQRKVKQVEGQFATVVDVVAFYEQTFPQRLKAVRAMTPSDLAKHISFFGVMEMPAASFLGPANNHSVHHRGQLAAYLRAMGSTVPAIYGGSADEIPSWVATVRSQPKWPEEPVQGA